VTTELTSTTITNILEAVPGIKNVLRSPAADAMVNLTRSAAGLAAFDLKDARELLRFAFRRGLIGNEEHDRVLTEVESAAQARQDRLAARKAARDDLARARGKAAGKPRPARAKGVHKAKTRPALGARKPGAGRAKPAKKKAKPVAKRGKAAHGKAKAAKRVRPSSRPRPKAAKGKKRR